ncbi:MAG: D-alanyl-D-alanine carboxypeptidase/D-alanyl-D-alanine-endopeptidase [Bacteroidetes bacterium]|nr:MAG: D-alanyl-D-alanine carboxypeptidase/D-alanyl-D-alanine-endopeptidase [Bacteroidota bacterium]
MFRSIAWLSLFALYFLTLTCSQSTKKPLPTQTPTTPKTTQKVGELIEKLTQDSAMQTGLLGFSVRDLKAQTETIAHQAGKMLNLASCQKAITTATALELLGADFRFKTELQRDKQGNVYIKGFGDATFASNIMAKAVLSLDEVLATWVGELKLKNITQITQIIADETAWNYDAMPSHWIWSDMGNYYGAPAYALNVGDNTYELTFKPTQVGKPAKLIQTKPTLPEVQFINEVRTAPAGTGDQASIAGGSYEPVRYASGTIPMDFQTFSIKGAMPDPAYYLAWYCTQYIRAQGINIRQEATTTRRLALAGKQASTDRETLHTHFSPPLRLICDYVNLYSVNLFAEAILKQIGATFPTDKPDNTPLRAGIGKTKAFWEQKGIARETFYMFDGSGLSVSNGITPSQMSLLLAQAQTLTTYKAFYNSLPVAGISGTMRNVGAGTKMHHNLRAKTGGMSQVMAFSGYFKGTSGKEYAFCLVANRYTGKGAYIQQKLAEIMEAMVGEL